MNTREYFGNFYFDKNTSFQVGNLWQVGYDANLVFTVDHSVIIFNIVTIVFLINHYHFQPCKLFQILDSFHLTAFINCGPFSPFRIHLWFFDQVTSWTVHLQFDSPLESLDCYIAEASSSDNVINPPHDDHQDPVIATLLRL